MRRKMQAVKKGGKWAAALWLRVGWLLRMEHGSRKVRHGLFCRRGDGDEAKQNFEAG